MSTSETSGPTLLVLASTYPRWHGDHEPGFVHELARRLTDSFKVIVISPHSPGAAANEKMDGVEVRRFRYAPSRLETLVSNGGIAGNLKRYPWKWLLLPLFFAGMVWKTWRTVGQVRPDVIHAHWLIPQGLVLYCMKLLGVRLPPYMITSHGADLFALKARPAIWLKRKIVAHAGAFTVVSRSMLGECARQGIPVDGVQIRPMGVDLTGLFTPGDFEQQDNQLDLRCRQILFVGRLVEKKGARILIAAMPEITARVPGSKLTCVGFGPELQSLKQSVDELGLQMVVEFLGPKSQEEVAALARQSAVFAAPFIEATDGDQEGLGLVIVEALGVGCPVVVSDIEACQDVVQLTRGACVVRQGSPEELADGVVQILCAQDQYKQAVAESRARLVSRFDWTSVAADYRRLLNDLLTNRSNHLKGH